MADDFTATVEGALIAGIVGLVVVYVQQRWQRRQLMNDTTLAPMFDYAKEVAESDPDSLFGEDPWEKVTAHERLAVSRKVRKSIERLSEHIQDFNKTRWDFNTFYYELVQPELLGPFTLALSKYLDGQGRFPLKYLGMLGGGSQDPKTLFWVIYPFAVRNGSDPSSAWKEMDASRGAHNPLAAETMLFLLVDDPSVPLKIHEMIVGHATFNQGLTLLTKARRQHSLAVDDGRTVEANPTSCGVSICMNSSPIRFASGK